MVVVDKSLLVRDKADQSEHRVFVLADALLELDESYNNQEEQCSLHTNEDESDAFDLRLF